MLFFICSLCVHSEDKGEEPNDVTSHRFACLLSSMTVGSGSRAGGLWMCAPKHAGNISWPPFVHNTINWRVINALKRFQIIFNAETTTFHEK